MKNPSIQSIFNICIMLLIACLFAECKKGTGSPDTSYDLLSKDGLAYVQFNVGKYFIYKDSVANKQIL